MKVFVAVLFCCIVTVSSTGVCYKNSCKMLETKDCNAKYGKYEDFKSYKQYVNFHITSSMRFLLMSTYFGSVDQSREGFEKLFRKLSDDTWEVAMDLIKHLTLRGERRVFVETSEDTTLSLPALNTTKENGTLGELSSLGMAIDIVKTLAEEAHTLYEKTIQKDPELGSYIKDKLMDKHAHIIRTLAGLISDLKRLSTGDKHSSVGLQHFIMDEYLKKLV